MPVKSETPACKLNYLRPVESESFQATLCPLAYLLQTNPDTLNGGRTCAVKATS